MKLGLIIFLLLFSLSAVGKKLYKFQDENDHWSFADQPPQTKKEVTVKQLDVEPKRRVKLFKSGEENQPDYYFYNEYAGPAEIEVVFLVQENVHSIPELPHRFVIENGKSDVLFKVRAIDKRKPWSFKVKYNFEVGGPMRNYVSTAYYLPPIAPNASFRITQGFGGKISHTEEYNKYAVDISMPVGTPIHAARDGVVMSVDNDFYKHGFDKKYLQDANVIRILHKDGSMAVYAHLELEWVFWQHWIFRRATLTFCCSN